MSRVDKTNVQTIYEIDIDLETQLPKSVKMSVLTGVRGSEKGKEIGSGEHVAFHFNYRFDSIGEVESFDVPKPAQKLLH